MKYIMLLKIILQDCNSRYEISLNVASNTISQTKPGLHSSALIFSFGMNKQIIRQFLEVDIALFQLSSHYYRTIVRQSVINSTGKSKEKDR